MELKEYRDEIAPRLEEFLRPILPAGPGKYEMTFMARIPGHPDSDLVVSSDSALLARID